MRPESSVGEADVDLPVGPLLPEIVSELEPEAEEDFQAILADCKDPELQPLPTGFVISVTQGGRARRLQYAGFCFRVPGEHYRKFEGCGDVEPELHRFNLRCLDCFPAVSAPSETATTIVDEQSDSDGTASSSSSEEAGVSGAE